MTEKPNEPIFGDIPRPVLGLCAIILLFSIAVQIAPISLSNWLIGISAVQIGAPQFAQPIGPYPPYLLHTFVHGGWLHMAMNLFGLLAFGAPVWRWLCFALGQIKGSTAFYSVFFITAIIGALCEGLLVMLGNAPGAVLVGASGGLMGLIGILLRLNYGQALNPLPLFSKKVLVGLIPWIAINLIIAVFGAPGFSEHVAWAAHLGGLFAGLLITDAIAPKR